MTPLEMIGEWRKGCSCAGPFFDRMMGNCSGTTHPASCEPCTVGLIDAIEKYEKKRIEESKEQPK